MVRGNKRPSSGNPVTYSCTCPGGLNIFIQPVQGLFQYALSAKTPTPAPPRKTPLHVEGFDAEQIWAQLEPQAAALSSRARRLIKAVPPSTVLTTKETELDLDGMSQASLLLKEFRMQDHTLHQSSFGASVTF